MCLIVMLVMLILAIQSLLQAQYLAGSMQLIIALGFAVLLIRNIIAVRNMKEGCTNSSCAGTNWFVNLFKKKEEH